MRTIINNNKADWVDRNDMDAVNYAMQQWLDKLDTHMVEVESRWGVDRLPKLVTQATAAKWQSQCEKINKAILENDLGVFPDLVNGAIRGCGVMEAEAKMLGHTPHDAPLCWTVAMPSGKTLAVVRHHKDAALLQGGGEVVIWTLQEIANIIEKENTLVNLEQKKGVELVLSPFDFSKGDEVNI